MKQHEGVNIRCSLCGNGIQHSDTFCPSCGALFEEGRCKQHSTEKASGVCVICSKPYCATCGAWEDGLFMCAEHQKCGVLQGMQGIFDENGN